MGFKTKKVIVAMSGGVDSSVAAALLKRAGPKLYGVNFDLVGIFMKLWSDPKSSKAKRGNRCCLPEAQKRAKRVAQILDIPFYVLNFEKEFKNKVVNYFLKELKSNRTPNPCIVCNKEIRFGLLLEKALVLDADFIATGHYVKKTEIRNKKGGVDYKLLKAKDKEKDQSYFLWQLSQNQLKYILFPIGDYTKTEVRKLAKKFSLPVFDTPESQELCFVQTSVSNFLKNYLKPKPGRIIDAYGKVIGRHQGLYFYTIGQRRGLNLGSGPWYVLEKDNKKNILVVTKDEKDLKKRELIIKETNWLSGKRPKFPLRAEVKIRYKAQSASAILKSAGESDGKNLIKIIFNEPQRAATPGQSAVFYQREKLSGGGIISAVSAVG